MGPLRRALLKLLRGLVKYIDYFWKWPFWWIFYD